jgi:flagellum-specific ATP synthase
MNFDAMRAAVRQADFYRHEGKIEKIIGMTIEASGPVCNIGDVCRIFKKGSDDFIMVRS